MKLFSKIIAVVAAASIALGCSPSIYAQSAALAQDDFVHADGTRIVGTDGKELLIKGMAFGNNVWNNSNTPDLTHHTEEDYRRLAEMGFNCVRFYLNYNLFENDSAPYSYHESGFEWLDLNIQWAKKHGIGIIFNMHYPQGGYQSQGNGGLLWSDKNNQQRLAELWKAIARRYANEPTVWGYGLVNEPTISLSTTVQDAVSQCEMLMNMLADEIRSVSPYQAIFCEAGPAVITADKGEWIDTAAYYEHPLYFTLDDDNVIYEFHNYNPFHFTHQAADWAGTDGISSHYPSRNIVSADYSSGWVDCISGSAMRSEHGWTYFETQNIAPCNDYNIAYIALGCYNIGLHCSVYADDLMLIETSPDGTETVLEHLTFDDSTGSLYPWSSNGTGRIEHVPLIGHDDNGCVRFGFATENFTASCSSKYEMRDGCTYKVTGWLKGENADIRMDFAKAQNIQTGNIDYLESTILPYVHFSREHDVPIYLGEFGVIRAGFENENGGVQWVSDMIDLCMRYNIGFNYHAYHEWSFGLYYDYGGILPTDQNMNKELAQLFKLKLKIAAPIHSVFRLLDIFR